MPKIDIGGTGTINSVQMTEQGSTPSTPAAGKSGIYLKADGLYVIDDEGNVTGPLVSAVGGGYTQGARVYNDAAISVTDINPQALTFNSERYDTDTIHDTGSNTSRLTCKTAGKYLIVGNIQWANITSGSREVDIRLNGTTYIAACSMLGIYQVVTTIYNLAENDYVELMAAQGSGNPLNVNSAANFSPEFMMQRIG